MFEELEMETHLNCCRPVFYEQVDYLSYYLNPDDAESSMEENLELYHLAAALGLDKPKEKFEDSLSQLIGGDTSSTNWDFSLSFT